MMSKEMDELFSKSSAKDDRTIEVCRLAVIASMRRKKIGQLLLQKIFQVTKFSFAKNLPGDQIFFCKKSAR